MTEIKPCTDIEEALKEFNAIIQEIGSGESLQHQIPRFAVSTSKFMTAFNKSKKEDSESALDYVKDLFYQTMEKHSENVYANIFDQDNDLEVDWLRRETVKPRDRKKKSKVSLDDMRYPGIVIYIDEEDPKIANFCIPLTAIYLEAEKIYEERKKNNGISTLPFKFLYYLYSCFYFSIPETKYSKKEVVMQNIKSLGTVLGSLSDESGNKGAVVNGLSDLFNKFTSSDSGINMDRIKSMMSQIIPSDSADQLNSVLSTVTKNVQNSGSIMTGLQESFKSPEVTRLMDSGRNMLSGLTGMVNTVSGNTESKVAQAEAALDPSLQE